MPNNNSESTDYASAKEVSADTIARSQSSYPQPEILLMDMEDEAEHELRIKGYNITTGSFGTPYRVPKSDGYLPVIPNAVIPPNPDEYDIVVIDLAPDSILEGPAGEKISSTGTNDWWARCSFGGIDPRPRAMLALQDDFDRILERGGVFVVFAQPREYQELLWGHPDYDHSGPIGRHSMTISQDKLPHDNWSFLSLLAQWLNVKRISGKFITIRDGLILTELLNKHSKGATFECTLLPWGQENEVWIRFAENKYAEPVSVGIKPSSNKGWIFIFPQLSNRDRFLTELIGNILPQMFPKLFPYLEGARWVERLDYEIPGVASRLNQIEKIQADARERIDAIEAEIGIERREHGYLHEIIRATGDMLVMAVQRAFEVLGFQDVVNMDEERERMGDTAPRREDLQIRDRSPLLLAEVKGVTGIGTENAKLQVWKYITPRIKQLDRTDIRGLSVLNHERHVPALERNNETPFQADILTNAEEHEIGLITTWDLYRLVRSYLKNGWRHTDVRDLFYQNGRIEPVPTHYEYVGRIIGFIERLGVVGVLLEQGAIKQGDRIAFELPIVFEEQIAESLQIDNIQVEEADQGQTVGILTGLTKQEAKNGIRVFRVLAPTELVPGERKS